MSPEQNLEQLIASGRDGNPRALGRLISMVENNSEQLRELMEIIAPETGKAHVIGITGSPGVGKSTSTSALITALTNAGQRVGVLAVDPSSPYSGGALLGDRIRMQKHATDDGVYIRSMASRGHLGGLAAAAAQSLRIFDMAGFDTVLVETVGVGQSEVEIVETADTVVILLAPGMGDGVQAAKAGILEIGDIFVVNKADRDGAQDLIRDLRSMIALGDFAAEDWKPPIVRTIASEEDGIDDLVAEIENHRVHGQESGDWDRRRLTRASAEVQNLVLGQVSNDIKTRSAAELKALSSEVAHGRLDPYAAADQLIARIGLGA